MLSRPGLIVGAEIADDELPARSKQQGRIAHQCRGVRDMMEHHVNHSSREGPALRDQCFGLTQVVLDIGDVSGVVLRRVELLL